MPDYTRALDYFLNASSGAFKNANSITAQMLRDFTLSTYRPQVLPHGHRLTLTQGTPVTTSDVTGATRIYSCPTGLLGGAAPLYDGTSWTLFTLPEYAIDLGTLSNGLPYDVYEFFTTAVPSSTNTGTDIVTFGAAQGWATGSVVYVDATASGLTAGTAYFWNAASSTTGSFHTTLANALAGTSKVDLTANVTANVTGVSMEFTAWTNGTTRATDLATQDGRWIKSGATTRLYRGSFYTTTTTTTADAGGTGATGAQRFLFNAYNQVRRSLHACPGYSDGNTSTSYTTTSTTWTQANGGTGAKVEFLLGLPGHVDATAQTLANNSGANSCLIGLAIDSTSTPTYTAATPNIITSSYAASARGSVPLAAGYHYAAILIAVGGGTGTYLADSARIGASADPYRTGIEGNILA